MYVVSAETFDAVPPATLSLLRIVLGVAALALVAALRGESLGWRQAPKQPILFAGAAVAASMLLQFGGTALTSAVEGSVVTMARRTRAATPSTSRSRLNVAGGTASNVSAETTYMPPQSAAARARSSAEDVVTRRSGMRRSVAAKPPIPSTILRW
ncbi:MAG: hypothetical protein ACKOPF_03045 [Candidatus Limnocylindrus sp.]